MTVLHNTDSNVYWNVVLTAVQTTKEYGQLYSVHCSSYFGTIYHTAVCIII